MKEIDISAPKYHRANNCISLFTLVPPLPAHAQDYLLILIQYRPAVTCSQSESVTPSSSL
jgi:hypothetical protein